MLWGIPTWKHPVKHKRNNFKPPKVPGFQLCTRRWWKFQNIGNYRGKFRQVLPMHQSQAQKLKPNMPCCWEITYRRGVKDRTYNRWACRIVPAWYKSTAIRDRPQYKVSSVHFFCPGHKFQPRTNQAGYIAPRFCPYGFVWPARKFGQGQACRSTSHPPSPRVSIKGRVAADCRIGSKIEQTLNHFQSLLLDCED